MPQPDSSRRDFLKQATLGTGLTVAGASSAFAAPAHLPSRNINDRINTAIIGMGGQGRQHIQYQTATPGVRIVTLCDPDENLFADGAKEVSGDHQVKFEKDMRRVFDDKQIDCIVVATPNYWHALATVWACQAGKDVYCEKPAHYCVSEGAKMIAAAKKYNRVIQIGTHIRANTGRQEAVKLLREGVLGRIYRAQAFIHRPRKGIGRQADGPIPAGVDYDLWCGPSAKQPFNPNRFQYKWHWFWETGNGETGNNGPHLNDLLIQAIDKQEELPVKISSHGGRFVWNDQGETPNTQVSQYTYADGTLASLEIRNLDSNRLAGFNSLVSVYGEKGYMVIGLDGTYKTVLWETGAQGLRSRQTPRTGTQLLRRCPQSENGRTPRPSSVGVHRGQPLPPRQHRLPSRPVDRIRQPDIRLRKRCGSQCAADPSLS